MGASGSGKSVLMECLAGKRRRGLSGGITFRSDTVGRKKIKISFIPQNETLIRELTVRELLTFSSRIQNKQTGFDHERVVTSTLKSLGLEMCSNNFSFVCSGGQQKRISVALELLSSPDIMILDEPTSGLDSSACLSLILLLKRIARGISVSNRKKDKKIAVLVSIHQPVFPIFMSLDLVYCLCMEGGRVFYSGPPEQVSNYLSQNLSVSHGLRDNPADIMMEASCGCFGQSVVLRSIEIQEEKLYLNSEEDSLESVVPVSGETTMKAILLLILRNTLIGLRDPLVIIMRLLASVFAVGLIYLVFEKSGSADSCPVEIKDLKNSMNLSNSSTNETSVIANLVMSDMNNEVLLMANVASLYFVMLMAYMSAVAPNVFQLPRSYSTARKEVFNKWYSLLSYVTAITITDGIFVIVINIFLLGIPYYFVSGQYVDQWRVLAISLFHGVYGLASQSFGHCIIGATIDNPSSGIFLLVMSLIPFLVISGAFVPATELKYGMYYVSYLNILRFGLEASISITYGNGRCGSQEENWIKMNETKSFIRQVVKEIRLKAASSWLYLDRNVVLESDPEAANTLSKRLEKMLVHKYISDRGNIGSQVMPMYDLEDDDAWRAIVFLLIHLIAWKLLFYFFIRRNITN